MASSLVADPYLWAGGSAFFAGLALGQGARALFGPSARFLFGSRKAGSSLLRSRRIARATAYLSLAILAAAGLFVLADKAGLGAAWGAERPALLAWAALALVGGGLAGFGPLVLGLPLAILAGLAFGLLRLGLEGWIPLRSAGSGRVEVARLFPYEVGPAFFRGQLELPERDSVPVAQELSLGSASAAPRLEGLELRGPLRLAALMALPKARSASTASAIDLAFYRVVGLAAPGAKDLIFPGPRHAGILDALLPLPEGGGLASSGAPAEAAFPLGLVSRTRRTSAAASLVALETLAFELDAGDFSIALRAGP